MYQLSKVLSKTTTVALGMFAIINFSSCDKSSTPDNVVMIEKGKGAKATPGNFAVLNYTMSRNDTTIRSSSIDGREAIVKIFSPKEIAELKNFDPLVPVLPTLNVGDSVRIVIPVDSFPSAPYPDGNIDLNVRLVNAYDSISLDAMMAEKKAKADAIAKLVTDRHDEVNELSLELIKKFNAGKLTDLIKTESGVSIYVIEEGKGAKPNDGQTIKAQYHGMIGSLDSKSENKSGVKVGDVFDSSFGPNRGQAIPFTSGPAARVIPAWRDGFKEIKQGTKAIIFCPAATAYGERSTPNIPANSDLAFYVEFEGLN